MGEPLPHSSPRRAELLDACYAYVLRHGLIGLSLRPLAAATGTSPRVLLYLFGSKDGLVRELLARARKEQVALVAAALGPAADTRGADGVQGADGERGENGENAARGERGEDARADDADGFEVLVDRLWSYLSAPEQRAAVRLTYEAFLLSLSHDPGPWLGFAAEAAREWLGLLVAAQPGTPHPRAEARATRALALVRGLLLDLLACDDPRRVGAAMAVRSPTGGPTST